VTADPDAIGRGAAGVDEPQPNALALFDFEYGRIRGEAAAVDKQSLVRGR